MKKFIYGIWYKLRLYRIRNWAIRVEYGHIRKLRLLDLTKSEKEAIKLVWGSLGLSIKPLYYRLFKTVEKFDARYLSDDLYFPWVIRSLNPRKDSDVLENKGLYDLYFSQLPQPRFYIKNVNGQYFNDKLDILSIGEAIEVLRKLREFLIKPTVGSCCGRNVRKVSGLDLLAAHEARKKIESLLFEYKTDFIIQEVIQQSAETAIFNPSSLNTIRISSLNMNGKTSVVSAIFRCGQGKVDVDNRGAGGLMIGLDDEGFLREYAYDADYNRYEQTKTGVSFKGKRISAYKELRDLILEYHSKLLPACRFAGWDLALDKNNVPVFIEVNLGFPGIQMEQMCTGPIFGDRTAEVVGYVKNHPPKEF